MELRYFIVFINRGPGKSPGEHPRGVRDRDSGDRDTEGGKSIGSR